MTSRRYSIIPRPSTPPVFDHLQYAKQREEAWGILSCEPRHNRNLLSHLYGDILHTRAHIWEIYWDHTSCLIIIFAGTACKVSLVQHHSQAFYTSSFWSLAVRKNRERRPGESYHVIHGTTVICRHTFMGIFSTPAHIIIHNNYNGDLLRSYKLHNNYFCRDSFLSFIGLTAIVHLFVINHTH